MSERRTASAAVLVLILAVFLVSCSAEDDNDVTPVDIPADSMSTIVLAWSDTGMHHINATYGAEVFLPPYNGLRAQVIRRGDPPEIVTTGITLEYRLIDNTSSYGKSTADPVRDYSRFWDDSLDLFGVSLLPDTGLNFVDPGVHNGLSGTMLLKGDHFQVDGIPAVPINDAGTWDPYQVAEITVRDASTHDVLARTRATVPVSDEWGCATCHNGDDAESVLASHDEAEDTTFVEDGVPVLCADCHGDPALGQTGPGSSEFYLSEAVHGSPRHPVEHHLLLLPPRDEDALPPEHGPHRRGRELHHLPRFDDHTDHDALRRPDPLGGTAVLRQLPHLRRGGRYRFEPVPRCGRPRRPGLPRLPRESPRPGPDDAR